MKRSFVGFVQGSSLKDIVPVKGSDAEKAISSFDKGSKVVVVVKSYYRPVELSQKNVFYVYVTFISKETGQDRKTVESLLRERYGLYTAKLDSQGRVVYDKDGKCFKSKPLSEYNTKEMGEFLERIHGALLDDFGLVYPDPKSYAKINYEI